MQLQYIQAIVGYFLSSGTSLDRKKLGRTFYLYLSTRPNGTRTRSAYPPSRKKVGSTADRLHHRTPIPLTCTHGDTGLTPIGQTPLIYARSFVLYIPSYNSDIAINDGFLQVQQCVLLR